MRSTKGLLALGVAMVVAFSGFVAAGALITGSTGSTIRLTPAPPSVKLNAAENATKVIAFDEAQNKTLTAAIAVDAVNPGTYTTFPAGSAKVAVGTVVDSHLIHSDIPSRSYTARRTGSVTFADDILGVVASTTKLAASDSLGAPGTLYAGTTQWRGLEGPENGWAGGDKFTISADRRTITFDVTTYVMDEIRILTKHKNSLLTTISDSPDPVQAGENVTYVISVKNTGTSAAAGVQVADTFPGATLVSATASGGCTGTTTVTCSLGSIAAGATATATVVVKSPDTVPAGGTIVNTATAPPGQAPAATASTTVVSPGLTTDIADSPEVVTAGNDVQYTLTVTNTGISAVANAHVIDTLPAGATLKSVEAGASCTGTGPIDCALGSLAVGASAEVKLVVTSPAAVPEGGTMTNSAVATPGTNVTATEDTGVEAPVDGVSKGFVSPGGSLSIGGDHPATLELPNTGDGAPVEITQGEGTFCSGPCVGGYTEISEFGGYNDPNQPIHLSLTYLFSGEPDSLLQAAVAFGSTIYKNDNPATPEVGAPVPACTTPGIAIPHPCVTARNITQPSFNSFEVTFDIIYISGDPKFGRR